MSPPLRFYNTLTRSKETFAPIDPANVRLYVCGPTVYDYAHIGNARPLIVFDVLFRLLRHRYGAEHVTYVRNITDVDDKINARAAERGVSIRELTEDTNRVFQEDVRALGCLEPTHQPRATEFVAKPDAAWDMIRMIQRLIERGHAYAADGHVLFSVPSMADYGRLSRRPLNEMIAGARVEVAPYKRGDTDFVLWKPSDRGEPGWDSPWGFGRPGWHIECSAMAGALLGDTFDIHGGGIDLVFPHHENEIAQSRCCFDAPAMANIWMHNGFLQVEGEKMSKSTGNFVTIRQALRGWRGRPWTGRTLRFAMLGTHYRQPIDWTVEKLDDARVELACIVQEIRAVAFRDQAVQKTAWDGMAQPSEEVEKALLDDLNTFEALTSIRRRVRFAERLSDEQRLALIGDVRTLGILDHRTLEAHSAGIGASSFSQAPAELLSTATAIASDLKTHFANNDAQMVQSDLDALKALNCNAEISATGMIRLEYVGQIRRTSSELVMPGPTVASTHTTITVDEYLAGRAAARARKDWAESDRIRDELAGMGIALKDNKDGTTTWEVKR